MHRIARYANLPNRAPAIRAEVLDDLPYVYLYIAWRLRGEDTRQTRKIEGDVLPRF